MNRISPMKKSRTGLDPDQLVSMDATRGIRMRMDAYEIDAANCEYPEISKKNLMHAAEKDIGEKRASARICPDPNKLSRAVQIDASVTTNVNSETHVISSEEVSHSSEDKEWEILYQFQRDYRLKSNLCVRKFLEILGTFPTKSHHEVFLFNRSKKIPSSKAGTAGLVLREKLKEFMDKELLLECE